MTPVSAQPYARNNYGGTIGGPLIIPGVYADTNRRTSFQLNYSGNHSTSLQDQYLTVPSIAMRNGDFSKSTIQLVNPATGEPFTDNQIPSSQYSPTALALLDYIPEPNVPGAITQNFHTAATTLSSSNSVSLRINQNLTPTLPQRGARTWRSRRRRGRWRKRGRRTGRRWWSGPGRPRAHDQSERSAAVSRKHGRAVQRDSAAGEQDESHQHHRSDQLDRRQGQDEQHIRREHRHQLQHDVESVLEHRGRGRARGNLVSDSAGAVELGRAEPDVLQFQRAVESREFPRRPEDQRQLHTVAARTEPSTPLRHGIPARQLVEPEQRQRPRHVHVHGPLLQQWRPDFADHGRRLRRLPARNAAAGDVAGGRSQRPSGRKPLPFIWKTTGSTAAG